MHVNTSHANEPENVVCKHEFSQLKQVSLFVSGWKGQQIRALINRVVNETYDAETETTTLLINDMDNFLGLQSFPGWSFFPDRTFPGKTIPGWSLSRKDVSRVVIFPDKTISYD